MRRRIAVIGAGQMAEALLAGLLSAQVADAASLFASDPDAERRDLIKRRFGIRVGSDNLEAASWGEVALLAVKPQTLDAVLEELAQALAGRLVVSIAAGVSIQRIAGRVPSGTRIVRAMPNAPALVREGMSALAFGPGVTEAETVFVREMFQAVGRVVTIEERLMDAVTGVSGSGPAFTCLVIEAMADGGVKMGLPRSVAELLATQTVLGAARMLLETGEHPARLKDRVASPGGTTIPGIHQLEAHGLRASLIAAVEAATKRSGELGR